MSTTTTPPSARGSARTIAPADAGGLPPRAERVDRLTWGLAVANLVAQIGIIVTGGAVRLTGSGLGCSQWPMCEPGRFTPVLHAESSFHPFIEFGNRTLTGVLLVIAVATALAVWRREPTRSRPRRLKLLALLPIVGVLVQALVGGITVWVDLHPAVVGSHLLLSLLLVAVSTYLLARLRSYDGPATFVAPSPWRPWPWVLGVLAAVVVVLGTVVTGAGPHSGDADEPSRFALDPYLVTRLHSGAVWLFVAATAAGAPLVLRGDAALGRARRAWFVLLGVIAVEGVIGYVQHFTGLPELLVGLHMLGAALVVVATTYVAVALRRRARVVTG